MKIASSSASFASELDNGSLTQLEWLDLCAAELELDGVVFDARHFPRTDGDYLAQLKKMATDLGLTVAALVATDALLPDETASATPTSAGERGRILDDALALGAPVVVVDPPLASNDPNAWDRFIDVLKPLAAAGKEKNVTLALRNAPQTLCATVVACKRAAKDVDSAWLRFAPDATTFASLETTDDLIAKTVIATHTIGDLASFASPTDDEAAALLERLDGFRGFLCLDRKDAGNGPRDVFHRAIFRLQKLEARRALGSPA